MLEKIYDNRIKLYAIFLLVLILILLVLSIIRATDLVIYEDGSYEFLIPVAGAVTGCFPPMGCAMLGDGRPLFYRVFPDFPPPGWSLIFGKQEC